MAISFVGSSNTSNGLAAGTSAVIPRPAGVVDGDFLLAFVSIGHTGAITAPAGWTEVPLSVNTAPSLQNRIYRKVAASEPASWTWTFASSAYVGICHATRGVGAVFAAQQSDDGLSLLSHTTPTLPAPNNAWLVSSWTGRNLVALGWAPPAGDSERQDVIGGLLVLLNVNHAVDDTNGPVPSGNYSKTALTLIAVRALDALVVLAPTLDPIQVQPFPAPVTFGSVLIQPSLLLGVIPVPVLIGALSVGHTLTLSDTLSPYLFGTELVEHTADFLNPILAPSDFGLFGIDSEITLEHITSPLSAGFGDIEQTLLADAMLLSPTTLETLELDQNLELVEFILAKTDFDVAMVLPESTVLLDPGLPIRIIPGSGEVAGLVVFRTFQAAEDGWVPAPVGFGQFYTFKIVEPECCTTT